MLSTSTSWTPKGRLPRGVFCQGKPRMNRRQAHEKSVGEGYGVEKLVQGKFILGRDGDRCEGKKV